MISTLAGTNSFNLLLKLLDPCLAIFFSLCFLTCYIYVHCVFNMMVLNLDSFYYSEMTLSCLIIKESQISVDWGRQRINRWWWYWFLFPGHPIHASFLHDAVSDNVDFSISNVPKNQVKTCVLRHAFYCYLTPFAVQEDVCNKKHPRLQVHT